MPDGAVKEEEDGGAAPSLEQFHDWVDQLQFTTVVGPERTALLERVARTVCAVDELGAEATRLGLVQLFMNKLHQLNRALGRGEVGAEASVDLFAAAVSACARAQDVGAYYKECGPYTPVPGAAVGAASTRPAALVRYRFPRSGVELDVQEASWKEAKRAWRVWGGAHVLSQMLDERPELVAGRRVVELGAGVGLCGVLAHALGASHVLLTDREMGSLPALRASLERSPGAGTFATAAVDWVDDRAALDAHAAAAEGARARYFAAFVRSGGAAAVEPELRYEVVLASDVIYDMESATTLASAFARRLALTPHALGLVAQGVRYHSLQQLWLNLLVDTYGIEARIQLVTITEECYSINDMMMDDGGARDPADLIRWSDELTLYDPQQGLSEDYAGQFIAIWLRWAHL